MSTSGTSTFEELVLTDVKEPATITDGQSNVLHGDLRLWLDSLKTLKDDVEVQLAAYKSKLIALKSRYETNELFTYADFMDERDKLERWRVGAIRFKVSVEKRMREVGSLIREERETTG